MLVYQSVCRSCTLPETNIAPENGWLEYYFPFGSGAMLVSARVDHVDPHNLANFCRNPRKLQHTPSYSTPQTICRANFSKVSLYSLFVKVARDVFQRCVETTLEGNRVCLERSP